MKYDKTNIDRNITTVEQNILWTGLVWATVPGGADIKITNPDGSERTVIYPWAQYILFQDINKNWLTEWRLVVPMLDNHWAIANYEHLKAKEVSIEGAIRDFPDKWKDANLNPA